MVVTRKTDLNLLLRYVKSIDSEAFLSVSSVMGVYGQGDVLVLLNQACRSNGHTQQKHAQAQPQSCQFTFFQAYRLLGICGISWVYGGAEPRSRPPKAWALPPPVLPTGARS